MKNHQTRISERLRNIPQLVGDRLAGKRALGGLDRRLAERRLAECLRRAAVMLRDQIDTYLNSSGRMITSEEEEMVTELEAEYSTWRRVLSDCGVEIDGPVPPTTQSPKAVATDQLKGTT